MSARDDNDKRLEKLEHKLNKIYANAGKDTAKEWQAFMQRSDKKRDELLAAVNSAETPQERAEASLAYTKYIQYSTLQNKKYQQLTAQYAQEVLNADKTAAAYINGELPAVYAASYNNAAAGVESVATGVSFTTVNPYTVRNLAADDQTLLPYKEVDGKKVERWATQKVNAEVMQGVLLGEDMPTIAKRLSSVTEMEANAAIRNARTAFTSAENKGVQDCCEDAIGKGVAMEKMWIATADARTRESHLELDGVSIPISDDFENGLEYPGDPNGDPAEVYNCRCTMKEFVVGFKKADGSVERFDREEIRHTHSDKIEEEKERRYQAKQQRAAEEAAKAEAAEKWNGYRREENKIIQGRDISDTWQRRPDKFEFEIKDVINAQRFDGMPRIVGKEEFDEAVKESSFVAQRTYSAPNQETLDKFRDQLYNGEWYVQCTTGGAQYGQGMYCAADYSGKLTNGIKAEMKHYQDLNVFRGSSYAYTETLTLAPDARIITSKELAKMEVEHAEKISANVFKREVDKLDLSDKEKALVYYRSHFSAAETGTYKGMTEEDTLKWYKSLSKDEKDDIKIKLEIESPGKAKVAADEAEIKFRRMDAGSQAALLGYDAINAEGHGQSGSYTVILNRTKVIFLGE